MIRGRERNKGLRMGGCCEWEGCGGEGTGLGSSGYRFTSSAYTPGGGAGWWGEGFVGGGGARFGSG